MDKLSFEVVSLILAELRGPDGKSKLAPYSTISRQWQAAVERQTFASLTLKDPGPFQAVISASPFRLAALRHLCLVVGLPTDSESWANQHGTQWVVFSSIASLLGQLDTLEKNTQDVSHCSAASLGPICLQITLQPREEPCEVSWHRTFLLERYFKFLDEDMEALPKLRCVSLLELSAIGHQTIHPFTSCQLATHFSTLQSLKLEYLDPGSIRSPLRKIIRSSLADGINCLGQLSHLPELTIYRTGSKEPSNHSFKNPCLEVDDGTGVTIDLLCESVRKLAETSRLVKLKLWNELISPDLFRDRRQRPAINDHEDQEEQKEWPSLQRLEILASMVAPSGRWYYTGNKDDIKPEIYDFGGDILVHDWRRSPSPKVFDPLAMDLAAAVKRMPRLKTCEFCIEPEAFAGLIIITLDCFEAGEPLEMAHASQVDTTVRRWTISESEHTNWKAPKELIAICADWVGPGGKVEVWREGNTLVSLIP
ncbi:hypothetical protein PG993_011853 [Apiospora rasikravindrae]|uniref:F-box domain-containing protein n=1 Tax=Apiospora rasikravindrae TaxID=990691 RepID=A0ABR1S0S8_9PEZI